MPPVKDFSSVYKGQHIKMHSICIYRGNTLKCIHVGHFCIYRGQHIKMHSCGLRTHCCTANANMLAFSRFVITTKRVDTVGIKSLHIAANEKSGVLPRSNTTLFSFAACACASCSMYGTKSIIVHARVNKIRTK